MESIGNVVMTWEYSPSDYLGELSGFTSSEFEFVFSEGEIKVTIPEHVYDGTTKPFQKVERIVTSVLDF